MSNATKIESHYEEAKALLPSQFYDKPLINAHLKALMDACQDVEDAFYDQLYINRFFENAVSTDLERIGSLYGVMRVLGQDDTEYRKSINSEILRRNSEGTPNSVKRIMSAGTGLSNMRIFEHSTGGITMYGSTTDSSQTLTGAEAQFLKDACPVTTGSCVFGMSHSDNYDNTWIPAELDVSYSNLVTAKSDERYFFNFNGDGYIETPSRLDLDADDPSFVVEMMFDFNPQVPERVFIQGFGGGFSTSEILLRSNTNGVGVGMWRLGGELCCLIPSSTTSLGFGRWRFEYDAVLNQMSTFFEDSFISLVSTSPIGSYRDGQSLKVGGRSSSESATGSMSDVKMWINGSTKETADLVLDMPINDNSNTIKDNSPASLNGTLTAGTGSWGTYPYTYIFGGDDYISTQRRWNPDAVDPSFTVEFYNDLSSKTDSAVFYQGDGHFISGSELFIRTNTDSSCTLYLGTSFAGHISNTLTTQGEGLWRIEYKNSTEEVLWYFNEVLQETDSLAEIGTYRNPSTSLYLGGTSSGVYDEGVLANVKFWINTETTNDLVLDMPIDDNSSEIKDYSSLEQDGTLTGTLGHWERGQYLFDENGIAGEAKNLVTGADPESRNIVVRSSSDVSLSSDNARGRLAEFKTTTDQFSVDTSTGQQELIVGANGDRLQVEYEGIQSNVGVPLESVQFKINSTVEQIQEAFSAVAPPP